jgi:plastocyanin
VPLPQSVHRQCGESFDRSDLLLGPAGELASAVVWLDGPPRADGEAPAPAAVLDQRRCRFEPAVLAARAGSEVTVVNSDPLIHNVRQASGSDRPFNAAMPLEGMRMKMPLPAAPSTVRLACDVHPWMEAWVRTFDHPHFAVTDGAGRFALRAVPAGAGTLKLWHPALGERAVPLAVPEGGVARPEIDWPPGPTNP